MNENSVLMDDLDLSSMEILTIVADLEETFGPVSYTQLDVYKRQPLDRHPGGETGGG